MLDRLGKAAYEAYRERAGFVSLASGEPLPEWEALSRQIKDGWIWAAAAAADEARRLSFNAQEAQQEYGERYGWRKKPEGQG